MVKLKYPCRNCTYFNACGDYDRTEPCNGRQAKPRTTKYYHMIVERWWTGERKEYISKTQGSSPPGWKCVAVCGYHEKKGR